jgi:hypothetical protein
MCEAARLFKQALAERGLDASVAHESDEHTETFYIRKELQSGDTIGYTTTINTQKVETPAEKQIALSARRIAKKYEEKLKERFDWQGRCVEVSVYDGPEAFCQSCGASVSLAPSSAMFRSSAELSAPQPIPVENALGSLDDYAFVLLKMYLLGKLRDECDQYCSNSKHCANSSMM